MILRSVLGGLCGLLVSVSVFASTEVLQSGFNTQGEKVFVLSYAEGRLWYVDELVQHADGWQDLVSRHTYRSRQGAMNSHQHLMSAYLQVQTINPMAVEGEVHSLGGGTLWPTTQAWNWEWEKKYAQWLSETMNTDFFNKYKVATDCADVAYSARWIFARINGLPVANHLSATNSLMTNQSVRPEWSSLPTAKNWYEDRRFRAALDYLLEMTYTHTLMRDSYPIAITPDNFLPGVHHLDLRRDTGHTQLVHRVDVGEHALLPYMIIQSTVPRAVRTLTESVSWGSELAKKGEGGFLRILWPRIQNGVYSLEKPENMPGYSLEQYGPDFIREKDRPNCIEIFLRLKPDLNFLNVLKIGLKDFKEALAARIGVVEEGFKHCGNGSCPEGSDGYEEWSTPARDQRLAEILQQVNMVAALPMIPEPAATDIKQYMKQELDQTYLSYHGVDYTLKQMMFAWGQKLYSSAPGESVGLRWGLEPEFFADKIKSTLKTSLDERKKKMSFEGDGKIQAFAGVVAKYCDSFSLAFCDQLKKQNLSQTWTWNGQSKTLQEWLDWTLWLNIDSRQTPANQWGALQEQSRFLALPPKLNQLAVSTLGVAFYKTPSERHMGLVGRSGMSEPALPAGFQWQFLNTKESLGYATADGQMLIYDFKTQTQTLQVLPIQGVQEMWSPLPGHFVLLAARDVWTWPTAWHETVDFVKTFPGNFVLARQGAQWKIFDFNTETPRVVALSAPVTDADLMQVTLVHPRFYILTKRLRTEVQTIAIEKATGVVIDISSLGTILSANPSFTKVISSQKDGRLYKANLLSLDGQLSTVASTELGQGGFGRQDFALIFNSTAQKARAFRLQGEDFVEVTLLSDEKDIGGIQPPYVFTITKGEKHRLRSLDGRQKLYEGTPMYFPDGQAGMTWISQLVKFDYERIVPLANPEGPALLTGRFAFFNESFEFEPISLNVETGVYLKLQGRPFWVQFP